MQAYNDAGDAMYIGLQLLLIKDGRCGLVTRSKAHRRMHAAQRVRAVSKSP
jgi:hypothetical protein